MYTQIPCAVKNSETPLTSADMAASAARLAAANAVFDSGNATLGGLISFLGGNPSTIAGGGSSDPNAALPGGAGVPTGAYLAPTPGGGFAWRPPSYPAKRLFPSAGDSYTKRGLPRKRCVVPDVVPLVSVFQVPVILAPPPPATSVPPAGGAPDTVPVTDCGPVTSDNICQLIQAGCVLSSQVSPAQLAACSSRGWAGNFNMYPAIAARGGAQGGKYFGDVNLNPAGPGGMSGLGDTTVPPWYCVAIPGTTANTCDMWTVPYLGTQIPIWAAAAGGLLVAALVMGGGGSRRRR